MAVFKNSFLGNFADSITQEMSGNLYNGTGLGSAPSGYGSDYDRLFAANPYRNLTYNRTGWQSFLSSLGFRTSYDTWREQAEVNAAEYDSRIFELMQQNEYNDPLNQANRMRQAGMNPDLLGTGDVAEAASQAPDPNGMQPNPADDFTQFGETFMSVLGRTMAIYKDFKSISEIDNIIEAGDLDNANKMLTSIDGWLEQQYQESDFINRSSHLKKSGQIKSNLESELLGEYEDSTAFSLGISDKNWKRWTKLAGERVDSLMGDTASFNAFAKAGTARAGATQSKLDPLYTKSDDADAVVVGTGQIIADNYSNLLADKAKNDAYQEAIRTSALENEGVQLDIEGQYLDALNENDAGAKRANTELAKYDAEWYNQRLKATTDNMQKQILDFLREKARTSRFASLMLMNWTLNNMVNMGISASANASVGLNLGLGANIANTVSTIFKP